MAAAVAPEPAVPNPAVARILRDTDVPTTAQPAQPPGLSMNPEAVRARRRRADARNQMPSAAPRAEQFARPTHQAGGARLTPATLRAELSSLPAPVAVATPEEIARAVKTTAMVIRAAGLLASALFKSDDMKVPDADATETAELIVDGWPELATGASGDAKKALAIGAVLSLVIERHGKYQRGRGQPVRVVPGPASPPSTGSLPHGIVSM